MLSESIENDSTDESREKSEEVPEKIRSAVIVFIRLNNGLNFKDQYSISRISGMAGVSRTEVDRALFLMVHSGELVSRDGILFLSGKKSQETNVSGIESCEKNVDFEETEYKNRFGEKVRKAVRNYLLLNETVPENDYYYCEILRSSGIPFPNSFMPFFWGILNEMVKEGELIKEDRCFRLPSDASEEIRDSLKTVLLNYRLSRLRQESESGFSSRNEDLCIAVGEIFKNAHISLKSASESIQKMNSSERLQFIGSVAAQVALTDRPIHRNFRLLFDFDSDDIMWDFRAKLPGRNKISVEIPVDFIESEFKKMISIAWKRICSQAAEGNPELAPVVASVNEFFDFHKTGRKKILNFVETEISDFQSSKSTGGRKDV